MTDQPIHNLDMTDTEYAALVSKGYDPTFERGLLEVFGEDSAKARKITRFIGLLKTVSPETDQEWKNAMGAWDDVCSQYDSNDSK
ncbi:MAG: hypothetical protein KME60_33690 [Cyanomargarita calcarea GSE-NOS-MK-12-04C]|jgi:hypothetical protein|uniref:Uncharacterized protein n=1 Tax=Cyanomargarita calcarea GSE-NOS-MK-12-04C TaxID=2839659 RepID=A0A951V1H4_9CYAN|nr:hypothetical protein [Cyanomargarita calcarea GSE-NOS-MK-12-04C]